MALSKHELSIRRIGGSSAAAALNLSKYERQEELRRRISYGMHGIEAIRRYMPEVSPEGNPVTEADYLAEEKKLTANLDNIHMRVGTFLEDFVRTRLKNQGVNVRKKNNLLVHPDYDYVTANIDGQESDTVEEIKCISIYRQNEFGDEYTDSVPMDYACQGHHYMLFPQFKHARLRCLFLTPSEKELVDRMVRSHILRYAVIGSETEIPRYGSVTLSAEDAEEYRENVCSMNLDVIQHIVDIAPLKSYYLDYDEEIAEHQLSEYADLWHRAQNMIPCVPRTVEDCQLLYNGAATGTSMIASDAVKRLSAERSELTVKMKSDKGRLQEIIDTLMVESGDADVVTGAEGKTIYKIARTWSPTKSESILLSKVGNIEKYYKTGVIDWKKVEADVPEIYQACRMKSERKIVWPREKGK